MKLFFLIVLFIFAASHQLYSQFDDKQVIELDTAVRAGEESEVSAFFRDRYLHNNFIHYIDNYSDIITYQAETTGDFQLPDITLFSISGNSYRWNKFYLNGFRTDSRFFSGSNLYTPDLYTNSLSIDAFNSSVCFTTDSEIPNSIALRYNIGGLGGISPYAESLVNLYHPTALQRLYTDIDHRRKVNGAGTFFIDFSIPMNDQSLKQQLYVDFGTRMLVGFDYKGIDSYYPEDFAKVELKGELPFKLGGLFDHTNFLTNYSTRDNLFTELNFSRNESAQKRAFNFSIYGNKKLNRTSYTTGFTLATNKIRHNNLNFSRNLIDQDGEAFEPWYPDADVLEFSHVVNFEKQLKKNFNFNIEGYNSLIHFEPAQTNFFNTGYAENINLPYQSLYLFEWNSNPFFSGLLENVAQLSTLKQLTSHLSVHATLDATLDGMLLSTKSMVRANWQGLLSLKFEPANWFVLGVNFAKKRVAFNYDHIRYFSEDYMNGDVYSWNDLNVDRKFQEGEKSDFFIATGGKYHEAREKLKQQEYFIFDMPLKFIFGKHEFTFLNSYKKYYNLWTTRFENKAEDYGFFLPSGDQQIFFFNPGKIDYVVDYYSDEAMESDAFYNFATNSPYFLSSTIKYQFTSERFFFSFAWTSYLMAGISSMGNGPLHNNIDVYSETFANPNNSFKEVGRLDQDRALTARVLMSYKLNKHFKFAFSGKFKDGQPFTNFNTKIATDTNGNSQLAIWNKRTKGINPLTAEFGSRDDAFFNFEIRTSYSGEIMNRAFDINLTMYNIYDFGTELVEYSFQPNNTTTRYAMELNIPRGLMISAKLYY